MAPAGIRLPIKEVSFGYGSYARVLDTLSAWLEGRTYVAGDCFTAADVLLASHLQWGMMVGMTEKRRAFEIYTERACPSSRRETGGGAGREADGAAGLQGRRESLPAPKHLNRVSSCRPRWRDGNVSCSALTHTSQRWNT